MPASLPYVEVSPVAFYEALRPLGYKSVIQHLRWQGPAEMEAILNPLDLRGATVADFGIGNGDLSEIFRRAGAGTIIGIDSNYEFLDHCRRRGLADLLELCDLNAMPPALEHDSVHLATASGLMSYVEPAVIAQDMANVVRPGGHVAVNFHPANVTHCRSEFLGAARMGGSLRVRHHTADEMMEAFSEAKCELIAARTITAGIRRDDGRTVPLTTHLYRKARNAPAYAAM